METLFYLGIIFVLGALTEWLSPKIHVPRVVGYLMIGLIIGPELLGIIPQKFVDKSQIITDLALSIIAVLVGATLRIEDLKGHGKEVMYITMLQSIGTFLFVVIGFILVGDILNFPAQHVVIIALLLGGIATATDTAAPYSIVHELKAKGNFTSTFLAVIAIDDAISLIMFSLALTVGVTLIGNTVFEWVNIVDAVVLIALSTLVGTTAALLNFALEKLFSHHKGMETISTLGIIFIVYSLSKYWGLEPLLSAMIMGSVMVNMSADFDVVEEEIDEHLTEIIFMLFFIISAMHLKLSAVFALPLAIGLFVVLRLFGKIIGSYLGAVVASSGNVVKKYMGIALVPQAGVAIGLALSIQNHDGLEIVAPIILNIVIATTLIYEFIGPFMTEFAIKSSGESNIK